MDLTGHPIEGDLAELGAAVTNLPDHIGFAATVTDKDGNPVQGVRVKFLEGISAITDSNGRAFQPANQTARVSSISLNNANAYAALVPAGVCADPRDEAPILKDW